MATYITLASGELVQVQPIVTSAGAADAGKLAQLDSNGRFDSSVMAAGVGSETKSIVASEALSAGNFVNIYNNGGTLNIRKADNSNGRRAHGFVLASVSSSNSGTVYYGNFNTAASGLTLGGEVWLGTAGAATTTAPSGSGVLSQKLGLATATTEVLVEIQPAITLV